MSRRPKVLLAESDRFSPRAVEMLETFGAEVVLADLDREGLAASLRGVEVLWVRLRNAVDEEILEGADCLRIIATATTGLNHIDLQAAERRGIRVISLRGETEFLRDIRATAEHTLGLMLALLRHIPEAASHARQGGWNRDLFRGSELYQKTVGIVGYGRLGRIVARYLRGLDATVLVSDPHVRPDEIDGDLERVGLDELLRRSDLVSLHVNLTEATAGFFGKRELDLMKEGAWLVNTARGELLDEQALLQSLASGRIRGAALDVIQGETSDHRAQSPLLDYARQHRNLLITPHIGGNTDESLEKTEVFLAGRILDALRAEDQVSS